MKFVWTVLTLATILVLATTSTQAFSLYNPQTATYTQIQPWTPNNYGYTTSRPSGPGLIPHFQLYPSRARTSYCDNNQILGHTSVYRPNRYYSGIDRYPQRQPMIRSQSDHCRPRSYPQPNRLPWR